MPLTPSALHSQGELGNFISWSLRAEAKAGFSREDVSVLTKFWTLSENGSLKPEDVFQIFLNDSHKIESMFQ